MQIQRFLVALCIAGILSLPAGLVAHAKSAPALSPKAYLPEYRYEFEPVIEGTEVLHDFVIQNQGDAPLDIIKVETG